MKLFMQQKGFAWGQPMPLWDKGGHTRYTVTGDAYSLGKRLHVHDLAGREAKDGSLLHDATSCSMCRRNIINAGIDQVIIRNTPTEFTIVDVEDWVKNDESIAGISCGVKK